jgi:hypothetical protein
MSIPTPEVAIPIQPLQQPAAPNQTRDYCSGLRKAYNGILSGLSSNNVLAIVVGGAPFYYLLIVSIYGSTARSLFGTATWIFMSVLLLAWILAAVAAWKIMPNLLSISVFIYTSMGHWCLVSSLIVIFYLSSQMALTYTGYILGATMPSTALLLFCGDVLRALRKRIYERIAAASAA